MVKERGVYIYFCSRKSVNLYCNRLAYGGIFIESWGVGVDKKGRERLGILFSYFRSLL